ncbi:MAG: M12 family metallopeptidase [Shewanella sp.]
MDKSEIIITPADEKVNIEQDFSANDRDFVDRIFTPVDRGIAFFEENTAIVDHGEPAMHPFEIFRHFLETDRILTLAMLWLSAIFLFAQCQTPSQPAVAHQQFTILDSIAPINWVCKTIDQPSNQRAVGARSKFWSTGTVLRVGFLGGTPTQIAAVRQHAPEWSQSANITFSFPVAGPYDIRISFNQNDGAWSYVGTDCRSITFQSEPTMNLGWISRDVILHEFGHALGLLHEHQNPNGGICFNEANVIASLSGPPNNWSVAQIRFNVLDKHRPADVVTTAWDRNSIMHYNMPANWTCNNTAIRGGTVLSETDRQFIAARYPGVVPPTTSVTITGAQADNIIALLNARQIEADSSAARMRRTTSQIRTILKK